MKNKRKFYLFCFRAITIALLVFLVDNIISIKKTEKLKHPFLSEQLRLDSIGVNNVSATNPDSDTLRKRLKQAGLLPREAKYWKAIN